MKRNGDPIISEFINLQKREMRGIVLSFDVPMNPRIDRMNGEGRGKKKKDGRSRTAATLYSTKRGGASDMDERRSIARNFINVAIIVSSIASTDILFSLN